MDQETIIQIVVSLITGGVTAFVVVSYKMGTYVNKVDNLVTKEKETCSEIKEIRDKVIACETSLKERGPLTMRKSPISLTERGKQLLNESGAKKFVDLNFDLLFKKVEEHAPKTAYDIQEYSGKVLSELKNDDIIIPLKEYAFKEGLEITDLITVAGIYLRDKILEKNGIDSNEIDKDDPKKAK